MSGVAGLGASAAVMVAAQPVVSLPRVSLPRVSVIINTLDRAPSLVLLLEALKQITYPSFEVIVVVGPCSDDTDQVLEPYSSTTKLLRCPEPNLSRSRNIGIAAAASDFVAFIDDDAVPEPRWLDELMAGFHDDNGNLLEDIAAVGGLVYDHTGHSFQCIHTGADRLGNARPDYPRPLDDLATPGSLLFPYAPGGNGLYRRDLLIGAGGFDEEYEYYLEETDLSARLIDSGWGIRQVDGGAIHHKFLPSGVRTSNKVLRDRFAVIKNKIYFSIVNGSQYHSMTRIMADNVNFANGHRNDADWHVAQGNMSADEAKQSVATIEEAWTAGLAAGLRGRVALGFGPGIERPGPAGFIEYPKLPTPQRRLKLCFVSQTIPPTVIGGIGRYFMDLGRELARRGHEMHVITTTENHNTVDLEDGVWVHRILKNGAADMVVDGIVVPPRLSANAQAVAGEIQLIAGREAVDAVYAAMWDVEHLAVMANGIAPTVTALVTTFGITLQTRPEWAGDEAFMADFGSPLVELERWVLEHSGRLHAISAAVVGEVERTSGVTLEKTKLSLEPIGEVDHFGEQVGRSDSDDCTVLFVGRFERRKGIDLLLEALPELMRTRPTVNVVLAGRDDLPGGDGRLYGDVFRERHEGEPWLDRVRMLGTVTDETLWGLFEEADVMVAPSRFESFGLVYVEGMMAGLPVVALDAGAAPEIVIDGETGVLVHDDVTALAAAIGRLCDDPAERARLGAAGRRRFEERFSVEAMADGAERLFTASSLASAASLAGQG